MIKLQIKFPIRSQMKKSVNFTLNVNNSDYFFRKQQPKRLLLNLMRLLVTIIMNFLNLVVEYVILTLIKALMLD